MGNLGSPQKKNVKSEVYGKKKKLRSVKKSNKSVKKRI